ncbi:sensor histidine kinase [Streptomyces sp. RFCAC02]|uniref:sensor histidine kinase n=1 Tax=Streptomyces sp. RFCAC02 TaxID=2499143 RepID=UPI00101FF463|nr:sensor histidine kinase [Streptomyces sp. RFCAC02]
MLDRRVRIASAAGLGAVFLAALVIQVAAIARSWGAMAYGLPGATAAAVVCALALLPGRQRLWPAVAGLGVAAAAVAVTGLANLPQEPSPTMMLGLAVLIGSGVRTLPRVPAGAVAAAGLAVTAGGQLAAWPGDTSVRAVTVVSAAGWLAAVATGASLRLIDSRARAAVDTVRREERLELARELHDIVAHHLTGMLIQAQAAQVVGRKDAGKAAQALAGIETSAGDALTAMRRVVGLLRDDGAAPSSSSSGPEQLGALVERFSRQGPPVRLRVPGGPGGGAEWPPEVTSTVYRIVREALTNIRRHAPQATSVAVTVDREPHGVTVEIADDGPPVPARPGHRGGYGLIGMRERVEALNGTLSAGPGRDAGWAVRATLPIPTREPR